MHQRVYSDYMEEASPACDVPGCKAPASNKHHVARYNDYYGQKNHLQLCRGDGTPNHHDAAHQGSSKVGLVLWRKLPPNHRAEVPKIGRENLRMYKKTLRVDQQVEVAFDEAYEQFSRVMKAWSPQENNSLGYPYIGGINQATSVVKQLTSTLNACERGEHIYEHRTRPVQLHVDGKTAKLYVLPVYASSTFQDQLEVIARFREKFGKRQSVDQCGQIITKQGALSDAELNAVMSDS